MVITHHLTVINESQHNTLWLHLASPAWPPLLLNLKKPTQGIVVSFQLGRTTKRKRGIYQISIYHIYHLEKCLWFIESFLFWERYNNSIWNVNLIWIIFPFFSMNGKLNVIDWIVRTPLGSEKSCVAMWLGDGKVTSSSDIKCWFYLF